MVRVLFSPPPGLAAAGGSGTRLFATTVRPPTVIAVAEVAELIARRWGGAAGCGAVPGRRGPGPPVRGGVPGGGAPLAALIEMRRPRAELTVAPELLVMVRRTTR